MKTLNATIAKLNDPIKIEIFTFELSKFQKQAVDFTKNVSI